MKNAPKYCLKPNLQRAVLMLAILLAVSSVHAASVTWNTSVTADSWDTAGSWTSGTVPASSDTAYFANTATTTVTVGADVINGITLKNTGALTLSSGTITIGSAGITKSGNSSATISSAVLLSSNQTWANNSSTLLTLSGSIGSSSGSATLTLNGWADYPQATTLSGMLGDGAGVLALRCVSVTMTLSGSNTFSGGLTIRSGQVFATNANALGTGTITLDAISGIVSGASAHLYYYCNAASSVNDYVIAGTVVNRIYISGGNSTALNMGKLSGGGTASLSTGWTPYYNFVGNQSAFTGKLLLVGNNDSTSSSSNVNYSYYDYKNTTASGSGTSASICIAPNGGAGNYVYLRWNPTTAGSGTIAIGELSTVFSGSATSGNAIVTNAVAGTIATWQVGSLNTSSTFGGIIRDGSGTSALTKVGTGTLNLSAANIYTGATVISAGELDVDGSIAASSAVTIGPGATLGGSGKVNGTVTGTDATISGKGLTVGATTLDGGSKLTGTTTASSITVRSGTTANQGTTISTGGLNVNAGAMLNNTGSATASTVTVENTASLKNNGLITATSINVSGVLSGTGTITGALTIQAKGELAPGNSPGTTTVDGSLTVLSGAKISMQLESLASFDEIIVSGGVTLGGTLALDLSDLFLTQTSALTSGTSLTLIDNTSSNSVNYKFDTITYTTSSGTYTAVGNTFTIGSTTYGVTYAGGDGNDVALTVVPEPSSWAMIIGGTAVLVAWQRRRVGLHVR